MCGKLEKTHFGVVSPVLCGLRLRLATLSVNESLVLGTEPGDHPQPRRDMEMYEVASKMNISFFLAVDIFKVDIDIHMISVVWGNPEIQDRGYGLSVYVLPEFICWSPNPQPPPGGSIRWWGLREMLMS